MPRRKSYPKLGRFRDDYFFILAFEWDAMVRAREPRPRAARLARPADVSAYQALAGRQEGPTTVSNFAAILNSRQPIESNRLITMEPCRG